MAARDAISEGRVKAQRWLFDRERDDRANKAKAAELHAYGVPCYWLLVSPVECQALLDGVVSTAIMTQAAILLRPGIGEEELDKVFL